MTDDLDEPWICKMSRREKMKTPPLGVFCKRIPNTPYVRVLNLLKIVHPDMCRPLSPCSKTTSWSSVWNMDLNVKNVISKKVSSSSSTERTKLSRAGHLTAGPRLQIITSRRSHRLHDEFSHLLNRGALHCRKCQLVYPHLRLRQLLECFGPDLYWQDGKAAFRRRRCTSRECLSAAARNGLSTALSLSCNCERSQE